MNSRQGRDNGLGPGTHRDAGAGNGGDRPAVHVLADRVASALVHHEPGWRLPRRSALARRYGVSPAEMEAAIEELAARNLLRRLPDGQVYRASPADYLIRLEGLNDLRASIDPMGAMIECASRHVSLRRVPEDIGGALGLSPGEPVSVVRSLWTSAGNPAAFSATYLPEHLSFRLAEPTAFADALKPPQATSPEPGHTFPAQDRAEAHPAGLYVELQPPAPSVARSLRLAPGQPAVNVTVRFDAVPAGGPMALATAVLRLDMFRVVVESPQAPRVSSLTGEDDVLWTHTAEGWDP
jgi:hypothetical protein